ncbi:hypothetical protein FOA52_006891 [Chlamydomonas sp. UWO 241]|nr:hypothetical protein FOA52_006891 [Chlamydomonas sp. UWO 241]
MLCSFVLSIPVARGANWFLAGGGRRMDEEEATAAAAERIAAAAEDGTSLPVRLATDVVRFLYGGTGRREPADGGVVSASLLNAKPAVGGIGVEPRGGGVLRVLFTVASDAVADTVVRWRHELHRCVDSTAAFDVLSDREEAQHQALCPAFLAAKVAGKRAQFHRARLVVDGERNHRFVLSIPVARGANWFLAGGGRRMDEEEATAAAAERIAAAAEDGTSLPVRLATDVVRFLYGGTGRREPADGGVVSASLLNAKPAVGGIGVEPRGGGVLRVLFTVASDAVADTVVRWRHELRRCVDSTAVFDVLSDREEAQHQALWPAFLAAKVAGKRAQFHRARLVVDGERYEGGVPCGICGHVMTVQEKARCDTVLPTGVIPGFLYLGSYDTASRSEILKAMAITHILNTVPTCEALYKNTFQYHTVSSAPPHFQECIDFIDSVKDIPDSKVLVYCMSGCSRSPTIIIAYLMKTRRWRLLESYKWVKEKRPMVRINEQDSKRLMDLELSMYNSCSVPQGFEAVDAGTTAQGGFTVPGGLSGGHNHGHGAAGGASSSGAFGAPGGSGGGAAPAFSVPGGQAWSFSSGGGQGGGGGGSGGGAPPAGGPVFGGQPTHAGGGFGGGGGGTQFVFGGGLAAAPAGEGTSNDKDDDMTD